MAERNGGQNDVRRQQIGQIQGKDREAILAAAQPARAYVGKAEDVNKSKLGDVSYKALPGHLSSDGKVFVADRSAERSTPEVDVTAKYGPGGRSGEREAQRETEPMRDSSRDVTQVYGTSTGREAQPQHEINRGGERQQVNDRDAERPVEMEPERE